MSNQPDYLTKIRALRVTSARLLAERNALAGALRSLRNVVGKLTSRGGNERLTGEVVASMCRADDALAQLTPQDLGEVEGTSKSFAQIADYIEKNL